MLGIAEKIVSWLYGYFQRKRAIETELDGLKNGLLMTTISNHLDAPLHALRDFFTRHPKLLEKPDNRLFVTRWLMDPHWQAFGSVPGMWSKERYDQLRSGVTFLRA